MKNFILSFTLFLIFWLLINASLSLQYVLAGIFVSLILSLWTSWKIPIFTEVKFSFKAFFSLAIFICIVLKDYLLSNIEVALKVLSWKISIFPAIVSFKTELKNPVARMILGNTISFTPATITVDIKEDTLYIHSIDIGKENSKEEIIKRIGKYEKYLKRIYG